MREERVRDKSGKYIRVDENFVADCSYCNHPVPTCQGKRARQIATHHMNGQYCPGSRLVPKEVHTAITVKGGE